MTLGSHREERVSYPPQLARSQAAEPRAGHTLAAHQIGGVSVRIAIGHLDRMARCAVCDRALCSHTDAEFSGIFNAEHRS